MEDFRSKSYRDGRMMTMESNYNGGKAAGPTSMQDLRSYSVNYVGFGQPKELIKEIKIKRGKSNMGSASSSSKSWGFNDPELQRKKRVASYKVYAMEGKVKGTFRKSIKWIKETCNQVVYGWR